MSQCSWQPGQLARRLLVDVGALAVAVEDHDDLGGAVDGDIVLRARRRG